MLDIQTPRMAYEPLSETLGQVEVEPLDRGFGHTFGNSIRRVLLLSLEGAAVKSVKIDGVQHEFTTVPGVREDVTDIILNLRGLVCRLIGEADEIEVELNRQGPGVVTAGDITCPADLEPRARDRQPGGHRFAGHGAHHRPRPRLCARRPEQGSWHHDRRHPG